MIPMKKLFALVLALVLSLSLVACGSTGTTPSGSTNDSSTQEPSGTVSADDIPDTMTSSDGKYQVAFVTDVGQLKDKSFNQGTFDGVKLYANANGLSYKYYQPANGSEATDDDRYDAMKAAVDGGAEVVVCAGYLQEAALRKAALEFPDTPFVFIDGYPIQEKATEYDEATGEALPNDSPILTNVAGISFQEEQAGYLAGYAAVKDGFTKLGFSGGGGGTNDACCRFGYGYVQGANAAASEMDVTVDMNYSWEYGATFSASTELQTMISGWYSNGTEIVFACGGAMFQSIVAAASANDKYVIGVDVDQSGESDYVVTSAMKGLYPATYDTLTDVIVNGNWDAYKGKIATLGLVSGEDPELNYVQIPMGEGTQWSDSFTQDDYKAMVKDMFDGKITVSNDVSKTPSDFATVIAVEDQGAIKG